MDDDTLMGRAMEECNILMDAEDVDFATAMIVTLRDWINDYFGDDTGFEIVREIAQGKEKLG
jgi:hypothetical protein